MKPNTTFVDIGAFLGATSLFAAHCGGKVVAVEPDPAAANVLRHNAAANYPVEITVVEGAISTVTGQAVIDAHPDGWGTGMTRMSTKGIAVKTFTIEDLFLQLCVEKCALVNMDINGAEQILLPTVAPFLAAHRIPLVLTVNAANWQGDLDTSCLMSYQRSEGTLDDKATMLLIP